MKIGPLTLSATLAACLVVLPVQALTVFVDEDFESYGSQGDLNAAWAPLAGDGFNNPPGAGGDLIAEVDGVTNQMGNASTGGAGVINEEVNGWDPVTNDTGYLITPSASENIVMRGDIYIDSEFGATMRQTIGLRSDRFDRDPSPATAFGVNFVELGTWNGSVCLPTAPDCELGDPDADPPVQPDENARIENDFAYRLAIFDSASRMNLIENGVDLGEMQVEPNWQYFPLNPDLDLATTTLPNGNTGNEDGAADLGDIGSGWHTFEAVISETEVTLTLDLFRDGIDNVSGEAGVDATVVAQIAMSQNFNDPPFDFDPSPMNSFRYGSPSGVTSDDGVAHFDNLYLALEDAAEPSLFGDFEPDGDVDIIDFGKFADAFGSVTGDANYDILADEEPDGDVDIIDFGVFADNFGTGVPATAIPEPTTAALLAGLLGFGLGSGSRR